VTDAATIPQSSSSVDKGRHQIVDDRALDLADQQREAGIGEGVLDHAHDDEARARGNPRRENQAPSAPMRPKATLKITRNSRVVTAAPRSSAAAP
jgi:hypothetical protein